MGGHPDLLPGLVRDELTMTVCLPIGLSTDLNTIKQAAARRFAALVGAMADNQFAEQQVGHRADCTPRKACPKPLDQPSGESQSEMRRRRRPVKSEAE
ncbi:MAG: hypothetical protein ACR2Q4_02515 [Geminicoccaceae bacterium]